MPHWFIKSATQRVISWLPASHKWNELFQRYVTGSLKLTPEIFDAAVQFAQHCIQEYRAANPKQPDDIAALELGTGWYPVVPVALWLCNAKSVRTYDIAPLVNRSRFAATVDMFAERVRQGRLQALLPAAHAERVQRLQDLVACSRRNDFKEHLARFDIHALVQDARHTGLGAGSVDLFVSSVVLQHIPRAILAEIHAEFRRLASPHAVSSHQVNLADHFHYFDRSISPFNFLRFTDRQWSVYSSPLTFTNRMRYSDYVKMFRDNGWDISHADLTRGSDADLARVPLAPQFRPYGRDDLRVLRAWITAVPATAAV